MLRLAEEYAAVRGRAQLDSKIHELLPDAGVISPGSLHTKLLSLYWSDVYTTNYDTLLERTLDSDRERLKPKIKHRYQVVVAADGVPLSKRNGQPRIVKLHGSLRAGTPLILTEEDYRKYPTEFAPFVNTVQQSMLENVFCLIGFSGDDPNFLSWTGWARDHLGGKAPNIYLITLSPISEGQRLILEKRKIFPIDISELGRTKSKIDYGRALEAVLDFWQEESPRRHTDWPYRSPSDAFKKPTVDVQDVAKWFNLTQQNRQEYPGWLVAPASNRKRIKNKAWDARALHAIQDENLALPKGIKLLLLEEIRWIFETTLSQLTIPLATVIKKVIHSEDDFDIASTQTFLASLALPPISTDKLKEIEAGLLLVLLKNAREDNDVIQFAEWEKRLNEISQESFHADFECSFIYEKILFQLEHHGKQNVLGLLSKLYTSATQDADPYWIIRAGAIFGEVGSVRHGSHLVKEGLLQLRQAIQLEGDSTYLVSREQWAEWLLGALEFAVQTAESNDHRRNLKGETSWSPEPGLRARIQEIETGQTSNDLENNEQPNNPPRESVERDINARDNVAHPSFIMDEVRYDIDIADKLLESCSVKIDAASLPKLLNRPLMRGEVYETALTYLRLVEHTSLPPYLGDVLFTSNTLLSCFKILSFMDDVNKHMRIFSRASGGAAHNSADALELPIVESLSKASALYHFNKMTEALNDMSADTHWDANAVNPLKLRLEGASRLLFRLDPVNAVQLCDLAIKLYESPAMRDELQLHTTFGKFFSRAVNLLPANEMASRAPRLLSLSQNNGDDWRRSHSWPDISRFHPNRRKLAHTSEWTEVVETVLDEMAQFTTAQIHEQQITNCINRLGWILSEGCMTDGQKERFATLIWREVGPLEIPQIKNYLPAAFCVWPHPFTEDELKGRFLHFLSTMALSPFEGKIRAGEKVRLNYPVDEILLTSLLLSVQTPGVIPWSEIEMLREFEKLQSWWDIQGKELLDIIASTNGQDDDDRNLVTNRLMLIGRVVHQVFSERISLSSLQDSRLDYWLEEFWYGCAMIDVYPVSLLFAGLNWWPEMHETVISQAILNIERSDDREVVLNALIAAFRWLKSQDESNLTTQRFVLFLLNGLHRGPEYLQEQKLNFLTELLESGGKHHLIEHRQILNATLYSLMMKLGDSRRCEKGGINIYAAPLLRVAVVRALDAANKHMQCSDDLYWQEAINLAREDSLLLVRNYVPS